MPALLPNIGDNVTFTIGIHTGSGVVEDIRRPYDRSTAILVRVSPDVFEIVYPHEIDTAV